MSTPDAQAARLGGRLAAYPDVFDVIVVGGGPAGLSAALMLGRCRRRVLVCDSGEPRNRRSRALHGYLTRDGIAPADFNALGCRELAPYGIEFRHIAVSAASRSEGGFRVSLADGQEEHAHFLLLATGVADELPPIPGVQECYGRTIFHCPYCDGWEWRDRRLAVLGAGADGARFALSLKTWSPDVALCTNGARLDRRTHQRLQRNGIAVHSARIARLGQEDGLLRSIAFVTGGPIERDALFFTTGQHPQSDLAVRLGCSFTPRGTVRTGRLCDTNVPGLFVAGDASFDAQFVVVAAAEGVKAATAINKALQREELLP
jgi:thioredoxin reductase